MAKFKVGEAVRVIDVGYIYSSYYSFWAENSAPYSLAARYAHYSNMHDNYFEDRSFRVVFVGAHTDGFPIYAICAENVPASGPIFLFNGNGLESAEVRAFKVPVRAEFWIEVEATNSYEAGEKAVRMVEDAINEGEIDPWMDYLGVDGDVEEVGLNE